MGRQGGRHWCAEPQSGQGQIVFVDADSRSDYVTIPIRIAQQPALVGVAGIGNETAEQAQRDGDPCSVLTT